MSRIDRYIDVLFAVWLTLCLILAAGVLAAAAWALAPGLFPQISACT